jgi:cytochrome b subunit of formate dehydrogenase
MNKALRAYWLTISMSVLGVVLTVTNVLLWRVFPRGFFAARLLLLAIHKWVGLALQILVLVHLWLHWHWITRMTGRVMARMSNRLSH